MASTQLFKNELNACADIVGATTYSKRIKAAAKFCAERHLIHIKRTRGEAKPWTKDPILRAYRFTNVYRRIDKVTEWIFDNWLLPQKDNPNLGVVALVGRLINHPETLARMIDAGFNFQRVPNTDRLWKLFQQIKADKKQLVTGAYIVNTIFPKGHTKVDGSKGDYIANFFVNEAWSKRKAISAAIDSGSFCQTIDAMKQVRGIGPFIGNQAAVDLTYLHPNLVNAKDIDTTWNPGPGTTKGIRWATGNWSLTGGTETMDAALNKYLSDLNTELADNKLFSSNAKDVHTNIVSVSGPDASNTLCELSKYVWVAEGKRGRLKNSYKGA